MLEMIDVESLGKVTKISIEALLVNEIWCFTVLYDTLEPHKAHICLK